MFAPAETCAAGGDADGDQPQGPCPLVHDHAYGFSTCVVGCAGRVANECTGRAMCVWRRETTTSTRGTRLVARKSPLSDAAVLTGCNVCKLFFCKPCRELGLHLACIWCGRDRRFICHRRLRRLRDATLQELRGGFLKWTASTRREEQNSSGPGLLHPMDIASANVLLDTYLTAARVTAEFRSVELSVQQKATWAKILVCPDAAAREDAALSRTQAAAQARLAKRAAAIAAYARSTQ
jgi:hypothetical protein